MKGGGLTWAGWLMIGVGGLLIYAGMTGQSLVAELAAVLNGKSPKPDNLPAGQSSSTGASPNALDAKQPAAPPHPATIPYPTYGRLP